MIALMAIARRELRAYTIRPFAWATASFALGILGFNLGLSVMVYLQSSQRPEFAQSPLDVSQWVVEPYFGFLGVLLLFLMPLWTMRALADEHRQGSMPLLLSAPIGPGTVVLGKFLGMAAAYTCFVLLAAIMPAALFALGNPELPSFVTGMLGCLLLGYAMLALGLAASGSTQNPLAAAAMTFAALLLLWIIDWAGDAASSAGLKAVLEGLGLRHQVEGFWSGSIALSNLVYLVAFITFFLSVARQRVDASTWS